MHRLGLTLPPLAVSCAECCGFFIEYNHFLCFNLNGQQYEA